MQSEHHTPSHGGTKATYNLIFGVLFISTIAEVAIAELLGGGEIRAILLLAVTTVKAALVAAYYMHLKYDPPLLTWIFIVPMIVATAVILSLQGLSR